MDTETTLYEHEEREAREFTEVPEWIDPKITLGEVAAVLQGGCASGAYMPAVTYHEAAKTMAEYGDAVLDYLQEWLDALPPVPDDVSWRGLACHYLSTAVELWCLSESDALAEAVIAGEDDSDA